MLIRIGVTITRCPHFRAVNYYNFPQYMDGILYINAILKQLEFSNLSTYFHFIGDVSKDPYSIYFRMTIYGWYRNSMWWILVAFGVTLSHVLGCFGLAAAINPCHFGDEYCLLCSSLVIVYQLKVVYFHSNLVEKDTAIQKP